jgi:hypothetical protein
VVSRLTCPNQPRMTFTSTPASRRCTAVLCLLFLIRSSRHTFAVNRLTRWHRERRNVQEWLAHLSVYVGHVGPASTYWYVSSTPALLQTAAELVDALGQKGGAQ